LSKRLVEPIVIPSHLTPTLPDWPSLRDAQTYATTEHLPFDLLVLDYDVAGLAYQARDGVGLLLAALVERLPCNSIRITPMARGPLERDREIIAFPPTMWGAGADYQIQREEIVIEDGQDSAGAPRPTRVLG
jgi:hypothetical protein